MTSAAIAERITFLLTEGMRILFVRNPVGTVMGGMLGFCVHGVVSVLRVGVAADLGVAYYVTLGILLFNGRQLLSRKRRLPSEFEDAFEVLHRARGITPEQRQARLNDIVVAAIVACRNAPIDTKHQRTVSED